MRYAESEKLSDEEFRRLTGVKRNTFNKMIEILTEAHAVKKAKGGRPNKVSICDMLMITLEYLREYRTYFHIGNSFGISESYTFKIVRWVENTLIKDGTFSLPGKKALIKSDLECEVILIDATESHVERPKKDKNDIIQEKRRNIL